MVREHTSVESSCSCIMVSCSDRRNASAHLRFTSRHVVLLPTYSSYPMVVACATRRHARVARLSQLLSRQSRTSRRKPAESVEGELGAELGSRVVCSYCVACACGYTVVDISLTSLMHLLGTGRRKDGRDRNGRANATHLVDAHHGVVRVNLLPSQRRLHEVVAGGHHGARAEPSLLHVREKARGVPVRRQRAHPLLYPVLHDGEQRVALPD